MDQQPKFKVGDTVYLTGIPDIHYTITSVEYCYAYDRYQYWVSWQGLMGNWMEEGEFELVDPNRFRSLDAGWIEL